jgi:hypothetical protein
MIAASSLIADSKKNLTVSRKQLSDAKEKAKSDADKLLAKQKAALDAIQKLTNVRKKDALSVYGSFNQESNVNTSNGASAPRPALALKLGKVFSTGVAAQNLSEAEKSIGLSSAMAGCIDALGRSVNSLTGLQEPTKKELFEKGMAICQQIVKRDDQRRN